MTQPSPDEDVQRYYNDDRNEGDEAAVDRVHDEVREFIVLAVTADLQNQRHAMTPHLTKPTINK